MGPTRFLLISSAKQQTVVYTQLNSDHSARTGRAYTLIDSGLEEPRGIAFDHKHGHLYVADRKAKIIYRYGILVDVNQEPPSLIKDGNRQRMVEGRSVTWLEVDKDGSLIFTDDDASTINKIEFEVLADLISGKTFPFQLTTRTEEQQEALESATEAAALISMARPSPTDPPENKAVIYSIYEAKRSPHVTQPTGLLSDGISLFWGNKHGGKTAGTVVKGLLNPRKASLFHALSANESGDNPQPHFAVAVTNHTDGAYGVARTTNAIFFTTNDTAGKVGMVKAAQLHGTSTVFTVTSALHRPRGLLWDRDQTMYVADEDAGTVFSFPCGSLVENAQTSRAVDMIGAFGLEMLSSGDPAFGNQYHGSSFWHTFSDLTTGVGSWR